MKTAVGEEVKRRGSCWILWYEGSSLTEKDGRRAEEFEEGYSIKDSKASACKPEAILSFPSVLFFRYPSKQILVRLNSDTLHLIQQHLKILPSTNCRYSGREWRFSLPRLAT